MLLLAASTRPSDSSSSARAPASRSNLTTASPSQAPLAATRAVQLSSFIGPSTWAHNAAEWLGGAVAVWHQADAGTVTMSTGGVTFANNTAQHGGAMSVHGGTFTCGNNFTFGNNVSDDTAPPPDAGHTGRLLHENPGSLRLHSNHADLYGGALLLWALQSVSLQDVSISYNSAGVLGGAVAIVDSESVELGAGLIAASNVAASGAGFLLHSCAKVLLGGAVLANNSGDPQMQHSDVNVASSGPQLAASSQQVVKDQSALSTTILAVYAPYHGLGGAVLATGGNGSDSILVINGTLFLSNAAALGGDVAVLGPVSDYVRSHMPDDAHWRGQSSCHNLITYLNERMCAPGPK